MHPGTKPVLSITWRRGLRGTLVSLTQVASKPGAPSPRAGPWVQWGDAAALTAAPGGQGRQSPLRPLHLCGEGLAPQPPSGSQSGQGDTLLTLHADPPASSGPETRTMRALPAGPASSPRQPPGSPSGRSHSSGGHTEMTTQAPRKRAPGGSCPEPRQGAGATRQVAGGTEGPGDGVVAALVHPPRLRGHSQTHALCRARNGMSRPS